MAAKKCSISISGITQLEQESLTFSEEKLQQEAILHGLPASTWPTFMCNKLEDEFPTKEWFRQNSRLISKKLTEEQRMAIRYYTEGNSADMNSYLRNASEWVAEDDDEEPHVDNLFNVIKNAIPFPEKAIVYRAFADPAGIAENIVPSVTKALEKGKKVHDSGFFSTTLLKSFAFDWAQELALIIHVPAGARGIFVDSISESPRQREVIFGPGVTIKSLGLPPEEITASDQTYRDNRKKTITFIHVEMLLPGKHSLRDEEEENESDEEGSENEEEQPSKKKQKKSQKFLNQPFAEDDDSVFVIPDGTVWADPPRKKELASKKKKDEKGKEEDTVFFLKKIHSSLDLVAPCHSLSQQLYCNHLFHPNRLHQHLKRTDVKVPCPACHAIGNPNKDEEEDEEEEENEEFREERKKRALKRQKRLTVPQLSSGSIVVYEVYPDPDIDLEYMSKFCLGRNDKEGVAEGFARGKLEAVQESWATLKEQSEGAEYYSEAHLLSAMALFLAVDEQENVGLCVLSPPKWLSNTLNFLEYVIREQLSALRYNDFTSESNFVADDLNEYAEALLLKRIDEGKTRSRYIAEHAGRDKLSLLKLLTRKLSTFEDLERTDGKTPEQALPSIATYISTFYYNPNRSLDQLVKEPHHGFEYTLDLLCVQKNRRGRGVGEFLVHQAAEKAKKVATSRGFEDARLLLSPATPELFSYYEKLGFHFTGQGMPESMETPDLFEVESFPSEKAEE